MDLTSPTEASLDSSETVNDKDTIGSGKIILEGLTPAVLECMSQLDCLWREMGISKEVLEKRLETVIMHAQELFLDMVNDEKEHKAILLSSIEDFQKKLEILCCELDIEPHKPGEGLTLVALEKDMRTKAGEWEIEKYERIKVYKTILETEATLCKRLELPACDFGTMKEIPTKNQLTEIKQNIKYMEDRLIKHVDQFTDLRLTIFNLWEDLEMLPDSDFEKGIAKDDSEVSFVMSKANIDALKDLEQKLEKEKKENFDEASHLWEKIESLWKRLYVEESEIKVFKQDCVGFKPSTIKKLKEELDELEVLKLQHTQKFIEGTRKELTEIWDKCFFGQSKRQEFTPAFDENYTEETLELHEHQLNIMRVYYNENSEMYTLVGKREAMWKKLLKLENQENDPNRLFSNRGGALLKELKTRNTLNANLPKVEQELKEMIENWEEENADIFMVYDERYLEVIETQRAMYQERKEMHRVLRQKAKKDAMTKEMTFGSKPHASVKRNGSSIQQGTPVKSKSKINQTGSSNTTGSPKLEPTSNSPRDVSSDNSRRTDTSSRPFKPPKVLANKLIKSKTYKRRSITFSNKRKAGALKASCGNESPANATVTISSELAVTISSDENNESGESLVSYNEFSSALREQRDEEGPGRVILNSTDSTDLSEISKC